MSLETAAAVRPPEDEGFPLKVGEQMAWDLFFASVASIQYHPANPPEKRLHMAELAAVADAMMVYRRLRQCR